MYPFPPPAFLFPGGEAAWQGGKAREVSTQMDVGLEPPAVPLLMRPWAEIRSSLLVKWGCTLSPPPPLPGRPAQSLARSGGLINGGYRYYFLLFLTVWKEVLQSSASQTVRPCLPCTFYAACALEFPINLIGLDIKEPVVHGIPESINNLPFTAPIH